MPSVIVLHKGPLKHKAWVGGSAGRRVGEMVGRWVSLPVGPQALHFKGPLGKTIRKLIRRTLPEIPGVDLEILCFCWWFYCFFFDRGYCSLIFYIRAI